MLILCSLYSPYRDWETLYVGSNPKFGTDTAKWLVTVDDSIFHYRLRAAALARRLGAAELVGEVRAQAVELGLDAVAARRCVKAVGLRRRRLHERLGIGSARRLSQWQHGT